MQAKVILENGKVKSEYNVLFTFENENDETIIVYTDNKETSKGLTYAYIGKIKDDLVINELTDKEIEIANRILDKIKRAKMKKKNILIIAVAVVILFIGVFSYITLFTGHKEDSSVSFSVNAGDYKI